VSWTGVEHGGGPAPPTPENIAGVVELYPVGERFFQEFVRCRACRDDGLRCARGEPGADGQCCPYREHALISRQEHEAWGVLLACQGQLRLAPSRHVMGIDMDAALRIGAARGPTSLCLGNCCRRPRQDWLRRCLAMAFGMKCIAQARGSTHMCDFRL
jgi:hypothetical protein